MVMMVLGLELRVMEAAAPRPVYANLVNGRGEAFRFRHSPGGDQWTPAAMSLPHGVSGLLKKRAAQALVSGSIWNLGFS